MSMGESDYANHSIIGCRWIAECLSYGFYRQVVVTSLLVGVRKHRSGDVEAIDRRDAEVGEINAADPRAAAWVQRRQREGRHSSYPLACPRRKLPPSLYRH